MHRGSTSKRWPPFWLSTLFSSHLSLLTAPILMASFLWLTLKMGCSSLQPSFRKFQAQNTQIVPLQNGDHPSSARRPEIHFLPPQIQRWMRSTAHSLPPGLLLLLPAGLLGGAIVQVSPAKVSHVSRFQGLGPLGLQTITNLCARDMFFSTFAKPGYGQSPKQNGMYAEFSFAFRPNGHQALSSDTFVSLSCAQIQNLGFNYPCHCNADLSTDANQRIIEIAHKTFGS